MRHGPNPPHEHAAASRFALARTLVESRRDPIGTLSRFATMRADVVAPRFPLPLRVVLDADLAREVLVADAGSYTRPWLVTSTMRDGLGPTLFTSTGDEAMARRRLYAPVFAHAHSDHLAGVMSSTIIDELAGWKAGPVPDLQAPLTDLTLRVAARALLGVDVVADDLGHDLRSNFNTVIAWINRRFNHLIAPPAVVPTPKNRAMLRARSNLQTILRGVISERRVAGTPSMDVLQLLLDHQATHGSPSDDQIVSECVGFLFAGHETTASTLAWALYSMAVAPEIQERVAAEGDGLAEGRPSIPDVDALHDTGLVVEETLRLYPAGVGIARVCRRPTTLAGQRVRRGTVVVIPVYSIQRDPRRWSAPDTFDPDRFRATTAEPGRHGHLPFGWGPRACLGARFATMEARLALAMITSRWTVTYRGKEPPTPGISPALRIASGLPVQLEVRRRTADTRA